MSEDEIKEFNRLRDIRHSIFNSPDFEDRKDEFENIKKLMNEKIATLIKLGVNFNDQVFKDETFYPCPKCKISKVKPQKKSWLLTSQNPKEVIEKISNYKKMESILRDELPKKFYDEIIGLDVTLKDIEELDITHGVFLAPCEKCINI
jgi:hypothetical protein